MPALPKRWWIGLGLLGAVVCLGLLVLRPKAVVPGKPVEGELKKGESREHRLELDAGEVADVLVEQDGADVSLTLLAPDREELLSLDSPTGNRGPERLLAVAGPGGTYRLHVTAGSEGRYILRFGAPRPAGPQDRLRAQAFFEYSRGEALRDGSAADRRRALGHYRAAFDLWQSPEDRGQQLITLRRQIQILEKLGLFAELPQTFQLALSLAQGPEDQLFFLNRFALFSMDHGDLRQVVEMSERAIALARKTGNIYSEASAWNNLGRYYRASGENDRALACFDRSLEKWAVEGSRSERARTLANKAETLLTIGSTQRAIPLLEQSLRLDEVPQARRLLGWAYEMQGQGDQALQVLRRARELAREKLDFEIEAVSLNDMGSIWLRRGEFEQARRAFTEVLQMREGRDLVNEAYARSGLGGALLGLGDVPGALASLEEAEELFTRLDDPNALSLVLYNRALAERRQGRLEKALETIDRSLELVEELRSDLRQPDLRLSVIGPRSKEYDLKVDILLRLHERWPDRGYDVASFKASEGRRSRTLLEGIRQMGAGQVITPKLVDVSEVQSLLDAETALVAYTVGEEQSIVWWIEKDSFEVHQGLPPRAVLEPLVSEAYGLISRPSTKQRERTRMRLEQMGEILLRPVAGRLPQVRLLVVVADEALQKLPFGALPVPGSGQPLIESHAVVQNPSASLGAALRAREKERQTPPKLIALFGDPVFGTSDERFRRRRGGSPDAAASRRRPDEPARLRHSEREAQAILGLAPEPLRLGLLGFAASRRAAFSPELAQFRYIHLATHGLVNPNDPRLSGIQLSQIDPQGNPLEGILRFHEVYRLSLPADLVTLSACRTADGPQIRGEGVLGMSRSFLFAGASRVVGALWDVDDADAADLMIRFYQGVLQEHLHPAVALQQAQKDLRARGKQISPYRWAGFVLQGDWR